MNLKQSIFSGVKRFVDDSEHSIQWSRGAMGGAAAFGAYGAAEGAFSDRSTVIGGAIGGGAFGAAVGAGAAALMHKSTGTRKIAKDLLSSTKGKVSADAGDI